MKKYAIIYTLFSLIGLSCGFAQATTKQENTPSPAQVAEYLRLYGWYVGKEAGIAEIGLNEKEIKMLYDGFEMAARNTPPPSGSFEMAADMQMFLQERVNAYQKEREALMAIESENNTQKGQNYFAELSKTKDIQQASSGLFYEIKEQGNGSKPSSSSKVVVHYEGKLIDGTIFDSSKKRGEPATFPVDGVIPGFKEGIMLLSEGGKATLHIPAELGYGNMSIPGIPAGSTLVFDIELIKVL